MDLQALRRTGHAPSLVAALLHFDVSFMAWVLLGALGAYIGDDLGLSASAKGLMVAVPLLSAAFFRVLLGLLGDRYGPRRVGLLSMGVVVVALLAGWLGANSYGALLGVGVLLGVAGASFAIALPLASRHYPPKHQGLAMGIAGAGNSGTVLTTLAAPRIAEHGAVGLRGEPPGEQGDDHDAHRDQADAARAVAVAEQAEDDPEHGRREQRDGHHQAFL